MTHHSIDWAGLAADPRFRELRRRKAGFLWKLFAFALGYYFLLPVGAACFTEIFRIKVWGAVNAGLLFALSEFVVAWGIAFLYARRAVAFDAMAAALARECDAASAPAARGAAS